MKIKLLYIIDGLKNGGKERQLIEIAKLLPRNIFSLYIISFGKEQHYESVAKEISDEYFYVDKEKNKIKPLLKIWNIFKKLNPDIVHSWDYFSSFYAYPSSKLKKVKFINGSIRDAGIDKSWEYTLKRFFLKRAHLIFSNSHAGLNYYKVKGRVIYNAINYERFHPHENNNEFNIIKASTFSDYKDHQTFIYAAIQLVKENIVDYVYLSGDGPHLAYYQNQIQNQTEFISSKFIFTGAVYDIEKYLKLCKIGVLCSTMKYGEGISNSLLEYMAAGLIPIATNIGGSAEIIENNVNGFLFHEKDHNQIVTIIKEIKNNSSLIDRIIKNAQITINKKFNYSKNVNQLIEIYKNLADNK